MVPVHLSVYVPVFLILGILLVACLSKPKEDPQTSLRRARAERARINGRKYRKPRVHFDPRIKCHKAGRGYYELLS